MQVTRGTLVDLLEANGVGCSLRPGEPVVATLTTDRVEQLPVAFQPTDSPVLSAEVHLSLNDLVDPQLAMAWCNRWNSARRWPTCHVAVAEGGIAIEGEVSFPLTQSIQWTDLRDLVRQVLRSAEQVAEELSEFLETQLVVDDHSLIEFLGPAG